MAFFLTLWSDGGLGVLSAVSATLDAHVWPGMPPHAGCLCSLQVMSASSEEPVVAAGGGGGAAGVSDPPSFSRGRRQRVRSDQGALRGEVRGEPPPCTLSAHSDRLRPGWEGAGGVCWDPHIC